MGIGSKKSRAKRGMKQGGQFLTIIEVKKAKRIWCYGKTISMQEGRELAARIASKPPAGFREAAPGTHVSCGYLTNASYKPRLADFLTIQPWSTKLPKKKTFSAALVVAFAKRVDV
jgi:hypothetical protein